MDCEKCKEESCEYKKELLRVPCAECVHEELNKWSTICNECISGKCQFEKIRGKVMVHNIDICKE